MLYRLIRPALFMLDAERAHRLSIDLLRLRTGTAFTPEPRWTPQLETTVGGLSFPNPVGLAAGFDKDAQVFGPALSLGFGFVEVGTLTPLPQKGNAAPRLFRLVEDEAVINRMGFNNAGQEAALGRLLGGVEELQGGGGAGLEVLRVVDDPHPSAPGEVF